MSGNEEGHAPAYRREVARLVIETGWPIAHVAKEIGVCQRRGGGVQGMGH